MQLLYIYICHIFIVYLIYIYINTIRCYILYPPPQVDQRSHAVTCLFLDWVCQVLAGRRHLGSVDCCWAGRTPVPLSVGRTAWAAGQCWMLNHDMKCVRNILRFSNYSRYHMAEIKRHFLFNHQQNMKKMIWLNEKMIINHQCVFLFHWVCCVKKYEEQYTTNLNENVSFQVNHP